jgi:hypothetical protein
MFRVNLIWAQYFLEPIFSSKTAFPGQLLIEKISKFTELKILFYNFSLEKTRFVNNLFWLKIVSAPNMPISLTLMRHDQPVLNKLPST